MYWQSLLVATVRVGIISEKARVTRSLEGCQSKVEASPRFSWSCVACWRLLERSCDMSTLSDWIIWQIQTCSGACWPFSLLRPRNVLYNLSFTSVITSIFAQWRTPLWLWSELKNICIWPELKLCMSTNLCNGSWERCTIESWSLHHVYWPPHANRIAEKEVYCK